MSRPAVLTLASACTLVAVLLSVAGAWSRAGLPVERALFAAVAVLLTIGAHILPAVCRGEGTAYRVAGWALWLACIAAVVVGHLSFFVGAERHAGEVRAASIPPPPEIAARPLAVVAADHAAVTADIARARLNLARCRDCATIEARLAGLSARAGALEVEQAEARRRIDAEARHAAKMGAAQADPVAGRIGVLLGARPDTVSLAAGVASAVVLELLAVLLWFKAAQPQLEDSPFDLPLPAWSNGNSRQSNRHDSDVTPPVTASSKGLRDEGAGVQSRQSNDQSNAQSRPSNAQSRPSSGESRPSNVAGGEDVGIPDDLLSGRVKPTVAAIRAHLGCGQAKAVQLRRAWLAQRGGDA